MFETYASVVGRQEGRDCRYNLSSAHRPGQESHGVGAFPTVKPSHGSVVHIDEDGTEGGEAAPVGMLERA